MVIQRWQSVLLLVAVVMMGLGAFLPLAQIQAPAETYSFAALGISTVGQGDLPGPIEVQRSLPLFIVFLMGAILPLIDIFLFKTLSLQMKVCLISVLFSIAVCVALPMMVYMFADGSQVTWFQMACAPILALVAEIMAWQRMNADRRKMADSERFL